VSIVAYFLAEKAARSEILKILRPFRANLKKVLGVLIALSLSIYWLGRNYYYTKNPFYPYLDHLFKGIYFNPETYRSTTEVIRTANPFPLSTIKYFLFHPFANLGLLEHYSEVFLLIGLFISCVFVLFLSKNKALKYVSLSGIIFFLVVFFLVGINARRYYLPVIPFFALIFGSWAMLWYKAKDYRQWVSLGIIAIILVPQAYLFSNQAKTFLELTFKRSIKAIVDYNEAVGMLNLQDNYAAISYLNKNFSGGKVMVMFDNRLYYLDPPSIYGHPWVFFSQGKRKTLEEVVQELKGLGISYFIENQNWGYPPGVDVPLYKDFRAKYLDEKFSTNHVTVYQFK
jgi:hypothetical protein